MLGKMADEVWKTKTQTLRLSFRLKFRLQRFYPLIELLSQHHQPLHQYLCYLKSHESSSYEAYDDDSYDVWSQYHIWWHMMSHITPSPHTPANARLLARSCYMQAYKNNLLTWCARVGFLEYGGSAGMLEPCSRDSLCLESRQIHVRGFYWMSLRARRWDLSICLVGLENPCCR